MFGPCIRRFLACCRLIAVAVPLMALAAGCDAVSDSAENDLPVFKGGAKLFRSENRGVVMLGLDAYPISPVAPPSGVRRAVREASKASPCSAAAFSVDQRVEAETWVLRECARRRSAGRVAEVVLVGHSLGATEAGEMTKRLLKQGPETVVRMLITVDAIKSTALGATTGITTTLLTLNNPLPGKKAYFIAYDDTPPVDGVRFLAHVNYYQYHSTLYHGGPMQTATENHVLTARTPDIVTHATADDYAYPMILHDLTVAAHEGQR